MFTTNAAFQVGSSGSSGDEGRVQQIRDVVQSQVTPYMNKLLTAEFTIEEVKDALDSIGDLKVHRPDGMPAV